MNKECKYDKVVLIVNKDYLNEDEKMQEILDVIYE